MNQVKLKIYFYYAVQQHCSRYMPTRWSAFYCLYLNELSDSKVDEIWKVHMFLCIKTNPIDFELQLINVYAVSIDRIKLNPSSELCGVVNPPAKTLGTKTTFLNVWITAKFSRIYQIQNIFRSYDSLDNMNKMINFCGIRNRDEAMQKRNCKMLNSFVYFKQ